MHEERVVLDAGDAFGQPFLFVFGAGVDHRPPVDRRRRVNGSNGASHSLDRELSAREREREPGT